MGVTEHWRRLSRIVEFPSLETFKSHMGMILGALCQMNLLRQWGWAGWSPEVPSSSTPPAVKGLKKLAGTGHRALWGSRFPVFQVIFKAYVDPSAIAEVLKRLMYLLSTGKDIFPLLKPH